MGAFQSLPGLRLGVAPRGGLLTACAEAAGSCSKGRAPAPFQPEVHSGPAVSRESAHSRSLGLPERAEMPRTAMVMGGSSGHSARGAGALWLHLRVWPGKAGSDRAEVQGVRASYSNLAALRPLQPGLPCSAVRACLQG